MGLPIGRKLVTVGRGVGAHDLARQGGNLGRIVVLAQRIQIVQVSHEGRFGGCDQAGELGASATGERHISVFGRKPDKVAGDSRDANSGERRTHHRLRTQPRQTHKIESLFPSGISRDSRLRLMRPHA